MSTASTTKCPSGFVFSPNRKCYGFTPSTLKSWNDARTYCKTISPDYDLVVVDDENENQFLEKHIDFLRKTMTDDNEKQFWIGLYRNGTNPSYDWVDSSDFIFGSKLGEGPWYPGQPDEVKNIDL